MVMLSMAATSALPSWIASRLARWLPLTLILEKKWPSLWYCATRWRNELMPEWDSGPLITATVPAISLMSLKGQSAATTTTLQ